MKPNMFIGSSTESLKVARAVKSELSDEVEATIWNQGIFALSKATLESLLAATRTYDYAAFVLAPDDLRFMREQVDSVARDNVIFELGLFYGALGSDRCFFLFPTGAETSSFRPICPGLQAQRTAPAATAAI